MCPPGFVFSMLVPCSYGFLSFPAPCLPHQPQYLQIQPDQCNCKPKSVIRFIFRIHALLNRAGHYFIIHKKPCCSDAYDNHADGNSRQGVFVQQRHIRIKYKPGGLEMIGLKMLCLYVYCKPCKCCLQGFI